MKYRGKNVEIIGSKVLFGKETVWIHILEDDSFAQVLRSDLEENIAEGNNPGISCIRYISIAARIKEEMAQKRLLAPYESSLIPLPHQILVLEKVMQGVQTRFLLADEVGMGKTIEAGLIIKEKKLRGEVKRILLIVPKSAMLQWQQELKEHFNENFAIYDSDFITGMAKTFAGFDAEKELNFWTQHNQIIVSIDALKPLVARQGWSPEKVDEYNKYRLEAVVNADFDMIVFDEAHRMGGATAQVSRYQMADTLCNAVPNVLLLSATPHRGKSDHFRRVLQLIDPEAFSGEGMPSVREIEPYVMRSEKRFAVDYDGKKLFQPRTTVRFDIPLDEVNHKAQIELYKHVTQYVRYCFGRAKRGNRNATGLVMVMMQKLASSSTAAILSAMQTRLWRLQNGMNGDDIEDYDEEGTVCFDDMETEDYSVDGTNYSFQNEESALSALIVEAQHCLDMEQDAKTTALIQKIYSLQNESGEPDLKILVFTEFRKTQIYLQKQLEAAGLPTVGINGSMDLQERQKVLVEFKNNARVMVATDAAGESLNMQFCHVVFNYDLPWNPMAIEQRIGRVDRIGQKNPVIAFNMLTNNTVDTRVYEIIVDKLDAILNELGIDKSGDVLDSTIDMKKVNHLYLQSLLDPKRFDFASDSWLYEIRKKLHDYKSTEGALPSFSENDIEKESAGEIKYSPLPVWLEELMDLYVRSENGKISKQVTGVTEYTIDGKRLNAIFDSTAHGDNPDCEHLTLQHPEVKRILDGIDGNTQQDVPVIISKDGNELPGYMTLWKVSAKNNYETKETYTAQFIADNGKVYAPYGNDIWNRLVQNKNDFACTGERVLMPELENNNLLQNNLHAIFHRMEMNIDSNIRSMSEKKLRALQYAEQRINKIGIANIRNAKLKKLNSEKEVWERAFSKRKSIVPNVSMILTVRVNG
ncbi:MAG: helicase-related protein [Parabacteroides sp.]|nr:helicase-related protein [Parabacteroides sp.]